MATKPKKKTDPEIDKIKSKLFDINNRIDQIAAQIQQLSVVMDFHAHPSTQVSGRPMFLQDQYEAFVEAQQKQKSPPTTDKQEDTSEE